MVGLIEEDEDDRGVYPNSNMAQDEAIITRQIFTSASQRNQLSEIENQPKALQAKGRDFLTIPHDPSSLMESVRGREKCI